MTAVAEQVESASMSAEGFIGRIPVRNLWLLMLYASDLFRTRGIGKIGYPPPGRLQHVPLLHGFVHAHLHDGFGAAHAALQGFEIGDVWGIGHRSLDKLHYYGLNTAWDFTQKSESFVRK